MLIPLPYLTYDIDEAVDYYNELKTKFLDLSWSKEEMNHYISPNGMSITENKDEDLDRQYKMFLTAVGHREPFISWTKEECLRFSNERFKKLTENVLIWNIKYKGDPHPKIDRQSELQFGFAKKILDIFPEADVFELLVNPVGTKYNKHTDDGESFRVIIPIISDEGAVWHFDDATNVTQPPGNAYLLEKHLPHATDVLGPLDRVSLHFLLDNKYKDYILGLNHKL